MTYDELVNAVIALTSKVASLEKEVSDLKEDVRRIKSRGAVYGPIQFDEPKIIISDAAMEMMKERMKERVEKGDTNES